MALVGIERGGTEVREDSPTWSGGVVSLRVRVGVGCEDWVGEQVGFEANGQRTRDAREQQLFSDSAAWLPSLLKAAGGRDETEKGL